MLAVLLSFCAAWLLETLAGLNADVIVLAVVLALSLGRTGQGASLALMPPLAAAATEVGVLIIQRRTLGDVLFVLCVAGSVALRRELAVPFIAVLVTPLPLTPGTVRLLWSAVAALLAVSFVGAVRLLPHRPTRPTGTTNQRIANRMAVQLAVALAAAFVLGRSAYPTHYAWLVLTAYIVSSGNRGRGDVLYKGALRILGAAAGTVAATALAGVFGPRDPRSVIAILAALALATWLRPLSYAYWAGCVTAALAFLHGYFGQTDVGLLRTRLVEIMLGALLAGAAAWLVLPVRTGDVVRRRAADALDALGSVLRGEPDGQALFERRVRQLDQIAPPLELHRRLLRHRLLRRAGTHHPADTIDAVRGCLPPARVLAADPEALARPDTRRLVAAVAGNVASSRRVLGRRPTDGYRQPTVHRPDAVQAALLTIGTLAGTITGW